MSSEVPFSPVGVELSAELRKMIVRKVFQQPVIRLVDFDESVPGEGVYVLHYGGGFDGYDVLRVEAEAGRPAVIYAGKADNSGTRFPVTSRLKEHRRSIDRAVNLDVRDFTVQFLIMDVGWAGFAERSLIEGLSPLWNVVVTGFGNHAQGVERKGVRSRWDTLHPGRDWADGKREEFDVDALRMQAVRHLGGLPPVGDTVLPAAASPLTLFEV